MNPTAPGVYLVEVPSGNRTIAGVATSITAFVGRCRRGPTDRAVRVTNYGAFEKQFGGLWLDSTLSYSVRQFYQNGGSDAVIVRLVNEVGVPGGRILDNGTAEGLALAESTPGTGGSTLRARVEDDGTRHVDIEERAAGPDGQPVVVRRQRFSGADAAALLAAFQADESLVTVEEFADLPGVADWQEFDPGDAPALPARSALPLEVNEALSFQAAAAGADGNQLFVSILPSATDADVFAVVIERRNDDDTFTNLGTFEAQTVGSVAADVNGAALDVVVTGDPSTLTQRPLPVIRAPLAGGDDAAEATLDLPVAGLAVSAANPGVWGDQLRVRVDHNTRDPDDETLFNLTVEDVNDNGRAVATEVFRNLSVDPASPRFAATIIAQQSLLVRLDEEPPDLAPRETAAPIALAGGQDGGDLTEDEFIGPGREAAKEGLFRLADVDLFNLLVIPPLTRDVDVSDTLWTEALRYCRERRSMLLIDPPSGWTRPDQAITGIEQLAGLRDPNSVMYFPRVRGADPLRDNALETFAASGLMAGVISRIDAQRGVWKSPAGLEAGLVGVRELAYNLIDGEVGQLNPLGINCLQVRPAAGPVAWGARTLHGDDRLASDWKYLAVRRLALYIEESLYRGSQWAVFEPNDFVLWQQLRLSIGTFMNNLFRRGAFQGESPADSFYVKCDDETTTQADIDLGIVNIEVGFRPLKPAEFVVIRIRQMAGQVAG